MTDSVVKAKREPARKDADHEFFNMTLLAQVLSHKHQKQLIELNLEADVLLKEVKRQGIPFFNWNNWIAEHIETNLARFQEMKRNRISVLCRQGYNKLMNNIGKDKQKKQKPPTPRQTPDQSLLIQNRNPREKV